MLSPWGCYQFWDDEHPFTSYFMLLRLEPQRYRVFTPQNDHYHLKTTEQKWFVMVCHGDDGRSQKVAWFAPAFVQLCREPRGRMIPKVGK
jgi:hypothetical protein